MTTKLTESQLETIASQLNTEAIALVATGTDALHALNQAALAHGFWHIKTSDGDDLALYRDERGVKLNCWLVAPGDNAKQTIADGAMGFDTALDYWR